MPAQVVSQAPPEPLLKFPEHDFSDRLPPMLVKELRQGLRARTFVGLFVTVHAILCFLLFVSILAIDSSDAGSLVSRIILGFLALALLIIQPLRALGSVHSEVRSNTIEMMNLTSLSPWRIVLGKWFSLFVQSLLLVSSLLPYLILRYFLGGMELFAELHLLAWILVSSALFTTVPLGLSAFPNILIRTLLPLAIIAFSSLGILAIVRSSYSYDALLTVMTLERNESKILLGIFLGIGLYLAWNFLSIVTRQIAPASANLSTLHRLVTLVLAIAVPAVISTFTSLNIARGVMMIVLHLFIILPAVFIALSEKFHLIPTISGRFRRFGPLGRLAAVFLYPGWPSAVAFSILLMGVSGVVLYFGLHIYMDSYTKIFGSSYIPSEPWIEQHIYGFITSTLCCYNLSGFSALAVFLCRRRLSPSFSLMLIATVLAGVFFGITVFMSEILNNKDILWLGLWNPLNLFAFLDNSGTQQDSSFALAILQTIVFFGSLSGLAWQTHQKNSAPEPSGTPLANPDPS